MLLSTLIAYFAGIGLAHFKGTGQRKLCVLLPITVDLLLLIFFKYYNFVLDGAADLAALFHQSLPLVFLDIIVPVGISFYTFHTISYIIDAYTRKITPTKNFFEFACYVSLFSQLVCGPIVRFWQIEEDLKNIDKPFTDAKLAWSFFTIGLIEKVLLADTLGMIVGPALSHRESLSTICSWLCMIGFTYQYYFDFAGYSDMAVGLGHLFGLRIPQNFNSPFKARDFSDLARRWHISLYLCLRDFVFIPLLGIKPSPIRAIFSLFLTMLILALWHGPKWTFVVWGLQGSCVVVFLYLVRKQWRQLPIYLQQMLTFGLAVLSCTYFCSADLSQEAHLISTMFTWHEGQPVRGAVTLVPLLIIAGWLAHFAPNSFEINHRWKTRGVLALSMLFIMCLFCIAGGKQQQFLYFQF